MVKNLPANAGDIRDAGLIPGLGRSPGGGHGTPLQYSCLENPMDRGAWQATVRTVAKSQTRLKRLSSSMILNIPWRMVYRVAWIYLLLSFRMYLLFSYLIIIESVKQNVWNSCTPLLDPWDLQWILSALHFQQMPYLFHRVNKIHTISSLFCHNILTSLNMYQTFSPFLSG